MICINQKLMFFLKLTSADTGRDIGVGILVPRGGRPKINEFAKTQFLMVSRRKEVGG